MERDMATGVEQTQGAVRPGPQSRTPAIGYPGVDGRPFERSVDANAQGLARFLGWFSIGLGAAQVLAPRRMARLIGVRRARRGALVMRAIGIRELISGIGALTQFRPSLWIRARVAGDALDLALLGRLLTSSRAARERTALATGAVLGITVLDVLTHERLRGSTPGRSVSRNDGQIQVFKSITVNLPPEVVYNFWHAFENLPRFMGHLESVQVMDEGRSHWKAKAPAGLPPVEWDAEITADEPERLIAWRSIEGSQIRNEGRVHFTPAPGNRGTEVRVELRYAAPGGTFGSLLATLLGEEPAVQIADDLRAFKQLLETGDIMRSDTAVQGRRDGMQPARPLQSPNIRAASEFGQDQSQRNGNPS